MIIKIDYTKEITKRIEGLTNNILHQRYLYGDENVIIDEGDAADLIYALEGLKLALETTHLA